MLYDYYVMACNDIDVRTIHFHSPIVSNYFISSS